MKEALALAVLAVSLAAAIARPRRLPDCAVATGGALLLLATGVVSASGARAELHGLGPTIGFLAALLVLAEGCAAAGLFQALGVVMARGARRSAPRLLAMVFLVTSTTTAVLSLDATVVLLTPIVLVTVSQLRVNPRPHLMACAHLANSASLLLPVSNLTNLLAFQATGLPFARFAALMALPWVAAIAVEWLILRRVFATELREPPQPVSSAAPAAAPVSRFALAVLLVTLMGFGLSTKLGIAPVWIATAGAIALVAYCRIPPQRVVVAAQPLFLLFVLALGVIVRGASQHGLASLVDDLIPHGHTLPMLLGVAAVSAVIANLVNNLPATLIVLPVATAGGPASVLAMLIGVGVGPNLTYVGSLATLLWRQVLHRHDQPTDIGEFVRLGLLVVPGAVCAATVALWLALKVV